MSALVDLHSYRLLLDALHCGAAILSRAGNVEFVNDRLCRMSGRSREELEGQPLEALYNTADARAMLQDHRERFEEPHEGDFFLPLPDGQRLPVITSARPLGDQPPLNDYRLVTIIDISRQKQAERAIQEQYRTIAELSNTILEQAISLRGHADVLEARVRSRTSELREANLDTIYMLAIASEAKDEDTGRHVRRIQELTRVIALELQMGEAEADAIGYSSVLHDVGKMHIPDHILKKPGPLTDAERRLVEQHTIVGERILGSNPFFARARRIARSHHENYDGSGYPDARRAGEIPIEARIVHVADVFDALTHPRVYKSAWDTDRALDMLRKGSGRLFDPVVVDAFGRLAERGEHVREVPWPKIDTVTAE